MFDRYFVGAGGVGVDPAPPLAPDEVCSFLKPACFSSCCRRADPPGFDGRCDVTPSPLTSRRAGGVSVPWHKAVFPPPPPPRVGEKPKLKLALSPRPEKRSPCSPLPRCEMGAKPWDLGSSRILGKHRCSRSRSLNFDSKPVPIVDRWHKTPTSDTIVPLK